MKTLKEMKDYVVEHKKELAIGAGTLAAGVVMVLVFNKKPEKPKLDGDILEFVETCDMVRKGSREYLAITPDILNSIEGIEESRILDLTEEGLGKIKVNGLMLFGNTID